MRTEISDTFLTKLDALSPKLLSGVKYVRKNPSKYNYIKSLFINDIMKAFSRDFRDAEGLAKEILSIRTLSNVVIQNIIMECCLFQCERLSYYDLHEYTNHDFMVEQLALNL